MGETAEGPSTARDRVWRWYLASVLFLAVLYFPLRGSDGAVVILSVGAITLMLVAIPVGLRLHRPADVRPWYVILAGMAGSVVTNAISYSANTRAATPAYPSVADVLYVGAYVVVVAGFALFVRAQIGRGDRGGFIDALIVTAGLGVLSFVLLIDPYLDDASLSALARATSVSYPLLELALLGIAARLVFLPGKRPVALWFVCLYAGLSFAGDAVYGVQVRAGTFSFESGANALWIASFAVFGAAALHPSMRELTERRVGAVSGTGTARLVVLGIMAMLGPVTLAIGWSHASGHFRQVGAFSAAVVALVLVRMRMSTVDLETHRRAEHALGESEERARRLSNATFEGVIVITDGKIVEANRAFLEMFGLEAEQVVGLAPDELIAPESLPTIYEHLASGTEEPWELEVGLRDGRRMWHESRASTIPYGGAEARVISIRDITQRKAAEEVLRQAEERYRSLVERLPGAVYVDVPHEEGSAGYTTVFLSPQAEALHGYTPEEFLADPELWPRILHPEDRERALAADARHYETGEPLDQEFRVIARDGRVVWLQDRAVLLRDEQGRTMMSQGILIDITDRKESEALREARDEAERANRTKSELLSRMSHELRTPLNAILGFGQLLESSSLALEDRESVEQILKGGRHLLGLVDEVLEISRIDSDRLLLSIEPVSVDEVVYQALDLTLPLAAERRVELRTEIADHSTYVMADRRRLQQVLLNLLSNAVKFNREDGLVTVSARACPEGSFAIGVSDTGPGIPPEHLERLFGPFERLGTDRPGTGLSLALTKGLVEAMGGVISVESDVGRGSTFTIELWAAEEPEPREGRGFVPAAAGSLNDTLTVLYIEDNASNLKLIERILAHRPWVKLLVAMQGRLGLELAREHHPDLILLDLHLPDISGMEALRHLREDDRTRDAPVIVMSADATAGRVRELRAAGADEYLTKPLDVPTFLEAFDRILGIGSGEEGADG